MFEWSFDKIRKQHLRLFNAGRRIGFDLTKEEVIKHQVKKLTAKIKEWLKNNRSEIKRLEKAVKKTRDLNLQGKLVGLKEEEAEIKKFKQFWIKPCARAGIRVA